MKMHFLFVSTNTSSGKTKNKNIEHNKLDKSNTKARQKFVKYNNKWQKQ